MQANVKLQLIQSNYFEYEERPYINILPSKPQEAYKEMKQNKVQCLKEVQRVPFSNIRQLILMYTYNQKDNSDIPLCDILIEKLNSDTSSKDQNNHIECIVDYWEKESRRIKMLQEVTNNYILRRKELVSNDTLIEDKRQIDIGNQFRKKIKAIDEEKRIKLLTQKAAVERQKIEVETNHRILQFILTKMDDFHNKAEAFNIRLQKLAEFKIYISEYQKSLVFIIREKNISQNGLENFREEMLTCDFKEKLEEFKNKTLQFYQNSLKHLYTWRNNLKQGIQNLGGSLQKENNQLQRQLEINIYEVIPIILKIIQNDKSKIYLFETEINKKFKTFLPSYYDIKQVRKYFEKQSNIDQILDHEKKRIEDHLKINYGMMVPYSKTDEYKNFIQYFQKNSKQYLRELIGPKKQFIEEVIKYINVEYNQLYNDSCDQKGNIKSQIEKKLSRFEEILNHHEEPIIVHLQISCRKLLMLLKK